MEIKNKSNKNYSFKILLFLFIIFPISLLAGNLIININIFLISIFFVLEIYKNKSYKIFENKILLPLLLFWASMFINSFFSINFDQSIERVLGFLRFIVLILAFQYILNKKYNAVVSYLFKYWFYLFIIVSIDLVFEFLVGHNLLGFVSNMPGRLVGLLKDELKIGNFYYGFVLLSLTYFYFKYPNNKKTSIFLFFSFLIILLFIGERANFVRGSIILIAFFIITYPAKKIIKTLFISIFLIIIASFINFLPEYKERFFSQINNLHKKNNIIQTIKYSSYGPHYSAALKIFQKNLIFGVGIKNFRIESAKKEYNFIISSERNEGGENLKNSGSERKNYFYGWSTHPHQVHFEFLSETGIFGYSVFLLFFIYAFYYSSILYFKNKNNLQLSGILFVLISLIPIIPTGSFFTTYGASIFWINFAIMTAPLPNKNYLIK